MMKFNQNQNYYVDFNANEKAFIIQTLSGFGRYALDHLYLPHILSLGTDNETLGTTLLQALANSRTFVYGSTEDKDFFDPDKSQQRYVDWVQHLYESLGYKTKRALFKKMMYCMVRLHNGQIKITPMCHVKLEAWDGMRNVEDVILSLDNTPAEIGVGLKLALNRCR